MISYYGSKKLTINRYPKPNHKTIVEPFAGSASYAQRWHDRDVILVEKNKDIYDAWDYIINGDHDFLKFIPDDLVAKCKVDEIPDFYKFPNGLQIILRSYCNVGMLGTGVNRLNKPNTITKFAGKSWHSKVNNLKYNIKNFSHWIVINDSYQKCPDIIATYFIDPPYEISGSLYFEKDINYKKLLNWIKNLSGQIIVCENKDNSWLPKQNIKCIRESYNNLNRIKKKEIIYYVQYQGKFKDE